MENESQTSAPTEQEINSMYQELGVKAKAPTNHGGSSSGDGGDKTASSKTVSVSSGEGDGKDEPKDSSAGDKNRDAGDDSDEAGEKVGETNAEVSSESGKTDKDVSEDESKTGEDSDKDSEDKSGKRPGKSDTRVERRFQKLTSDIKERENRINELEQQLQESILQQQRAVTNREDPEYRLEDFYKVVDENGEVLDLDRDQAELAYRRWRDGHNQRQAQRNSEAEFAMQQAKRQSDITANIMRSSAEAYDTLTSLADDYPELDETSDKYDPELASTVMPIIKDALITVPSQGGGKDQIVGLKMNPREILKAVTAIKRAKRSLPLNGTMDSVDDVSDVQVSRSHSSSPSIRAANELYKELGIKKRL